MRLEEKNALPEMMKKYCGNCVWVGLIAAVSRKTQDMFGLMAGSFTFM